MGVLECDRANCQNIMCDRLSDKYGYICWECFDELVKSGVDTNIRKFMKSNKHKFPDEQETAEYRFDKLFPKQ